MSINRKLYMAKRQSGLCIANTSCQEPSVEGSVYCSFHNARRRMARSTYMRPRTAIESGPHHKSCSCDTCQDERQDLGEPKCSRCQLRGHTAEQCDLFIERFAARRNQESCHIGRFE